MGMSFFKASNKHNVGFNESLPITSIVKVYGLFSLKILGKTEGLSAENYFALVNHKKHIVIKKYKDKSEAQVKKIELVVGELASSGIPVPLFIKNTEGKMHAYINNSYFTLHHKINGSTLHGLQFNVIELTSTARCLAKLHNTSSNLE